ncbi:MAG: class I SAM-dependent methyltransferase [Spirochaetes bacterium]|jgi:23S rRNA (cytosine1962-C5)-methyltransferase|nr:class I SAM-dependent methyltransferase [Spirochaetota bacterium]
MIKIEHLDGILKSSYGKRSGLFGDPETDCFRLFNSDGDGIPGLVIDLYSEFLLVQFFKSGLYKNRELILSQILSSVQLIASNIRGILVKDRSMNSSVDPGDRWKSGLYSGEMPPGEYIVRQNGVSASVDLINGQNTGLFLDMREARSMLAGYYRPGMRMLNLFCHTALFSVHALVTGIGTAVNIDLSKSALERAKTNYAINGLEYREQDFICGDACEWLVYFTKKGASFDMVIFDPPTFSRNKKSHFSVSGDYPKYLQTISEVVPSGFLFSSVNSKSLPYKKYASMHEYSWDPLVMMNEPCDFTGGFNSPKAGLWARRQK